MSNSKPKARSAAEPREGDPAEAGFVGPGTAGPAQATARPVETPPGFGDVGDDPIAALRRLDLFRSLTDPEAERLAALSKVVRVQQDRVIPRAGEGGEAKAYYFLLRGQVAFAEFKKGTVPKGPPNPKKRVEPVMQLVKKNVALFDAGDFFTNDHVAEARGDDDEKGDVALYTCVNVVALKIPKEDIERLLAAMPKMKEAIEARAEAAYYRQTFLKLDSRSDIFDFYVRQGFEYAQAIKIIQADKCIDCDSCVQACEERHGIARIERFATRIGLIQFTDNCRTCRDARCLDPCKFDAIAYDQGEVIVYDNCVGCTLCAKACPHDAIRMVDVPEPEPPQGVDIVALAKSKGASGTVVAKGEEIAPKAKKKPKRIANKCDHCIGYDDMACITACPTAAIVQIDPRVLFRRDGGLIERSHEYFSTAPFELGYSQTTRTQGVALMRALFLLTSLGVLACIWELGVRRAGAPSLSLWRAIVSAVSGPEAAASLVLGYSPAVGMGRWMGYAGAAMMTVSTLYTLRLHVPGLRRIGSSRTWFDFHVVFGLAGPVLALLHTNLNVIQTYWVSFLFWAVVLVVLTGVVGRYLYTALPRAEATVERDKRKLDDGIRQAADQWGSLTMSANVLQQFVKAQQKTEDAAGARTGKTGVFTVVGLLVGSQLRRLKAAIELRTRLLGRMKNAELKRAAIQLMTHRAAIDERMRLIGVARGLLARWRAFHIALSIVMFLMLIAHVAISIFATGL